MRYQVVIATLFLILSGCGGESVADSSTAEDAGTTLASTTLPPTTTTSLVPTTTTAEPEPVDPSTLHGTWHVFDTQSEYIVFHEDGTFAAAYNPAGEAPFDSGNWVLDGTELRFHSSSDTRYCPGQSGRYQVAFSDDLMRVSFPRLVIDECSARRDHIRAGLERVEEG